MSSIIERIDQLLEEEADKKTKKWSGKIKTKWEAPESLFTKSAAEIARVIKRNHSDLKSAMGSLNYYINRAGKNLSTERKHTLEVAKEKLHKLYKGKEEK